MAGDLPWRRTRNPYRVLVSEIMLQQTQVDRVIPKWRGFLRRYPSWKQLAAAKHRDVIMIWDGLGYNRRAVHLHQVAKFVIRDYRGRLPRSVEELRKLPGIGPYTAAAVASLVFDVDTPIIDTNIERVLRRFFAPDRTCPDSRLTPRRYGELASTLAPPGRSRDWNLAMMDVGSQVCAARRPQCQECPLARWCRGRVAFVHGYNPPRRAAAKSVQPFYQSNRYYRGRIVKALRALAAGEALSLSKLGPRIKTDYRPADLAWLRQEAEKMSQEGLIDIRKCGRHLMLRLPV